MKYRTLGMDLGRDFRNDLNANFGDVDNDVKALDSRVTNIVADAGSSNTEIVDAREGFTVLRDRLDDSDTKLGQKALQTDLDATNTQLADTTQRIKERSINIKDFGAKNVEEDTTFDNYHPIQEALNYLDSVGGGTLLIPSEVFGIDEIPYIPSNVHVLGSGGSTLKKLNDNKREMIRTKRGFHDDGYSGYSANQNITIENIIIDGNGLEVNGIILAHASNVAVKNVTGKNIGIHLVDLIGVDGALVTGCYVDSEGITLPNSSVIQIDQAQLGSASSVNISDHSCKNITVVDNTLKNNNSTVGCIHIHRGTEENPHEGIIVKGNKISNCVYGIYKDNNRHAKDIIISDNTINTCTIGIYLRGPFNNLTLSNNTVSKASQRCIDIRGENNIPIHGISLASNVVRDFVLHGISVTIAEDFTLIGNMVDKENNNSTTSRGITLHNAKRGQLIGNQVKGGLSNLSSGIRLQQSEQGLTNDIQLIGNFISKANSRIDLVEVATSDNIRLIANQGRLTENSGQATIGALNQSSVSVLITHGLGGTPNPPKPSDFMITPTTDLGLAKSYWIGEVGASTFRIFIDQPALKEGGVGFVWWARVL